MQHPNRALGSLSGYLLGSLTVLLLGGAAWSGSQDLVVAEHPPGSVAVVPAARQVLVHTGNPLLFVTQVPIPGDLNPVTTTLGNHLGGPEHAGRGGDLWVRYPQGGLRNLTREAGFGVPGFQGRDSIAVRQPTVHWSGTRALFSMVVGAPTGPGQGDSDALFFWQVYEVRGFPKGEGVVILRVPGQPAGANNTSPIYGSDECIYFTSDRPRDGSPHLYPQLDEYEMQPSTSGIWQLDPTTGDLRILDHLPSGGFDLSLDSYGRLVFSRWDHLARDLFFPLEAIGAVPYKPFNWSGEEADSVMLLGDATEFFPEPRPTWIDYVDSQQPGFTGDLAGWKAWIVGHEFDHFLPWAINQDGTGEETLIHVGRHELATNLRRARDDDPALSDYQLGTLPAVSNQNAILNALQLCEDPLEPGTFFAVNSPLHRSQASGQLVRLRGLAPGSDPNEVVLDHLTHPDTFGAVITKTHTGRYRNPLPLSDGQWIASHSTYGGWEQNLGTATEPESPHDFHLVEVVTDDSPSGPYRAGPRLTGGLPASVQYWANDALVSWSGELWELEPVEIVARAVPPLTSEPATPPAPEMQILSEEQVDLAELVAWLESNDLALIVSRDVTTRDANDRLQPYNLRIAGTSHQTVGSPVDTVYDLAWFQIFQADLMRGLLLANGNPLPGRRVLPRPLHEALPLAVNPTGAGAPPGGVALAPDGSLAAVVPARRALTWATTDPAGDAVVSERYWLTFQPGEIRVCASCHGVNEFDQAGQAPPSNPPEALRTLLTNLKAQGALR